MARADQLHEPEQEPLGTFTADGGWDEKRPRDLRWKFIDALIQTRRSMVRHYSPRDFVMHIEALRIGIHWTPADGNTEKPPKFPKNFCDMFCSETLYDWLNLRDFDDWPSAPVRRACESAVKFAGYGADTAWAGGRAVPADEMLPEPPVPPGLVPLGTAVREYILRHDVPTAPDLGAVVRRLGLELGVPEAEGYASRLEAIGPEVTSFPLFPTESDLARIQAGEADPRWWQRRAPEFPTLPIPEDV